MQPNRRKSYLFLLILIIILASLACGSLEVGVVTPTSEDELANAVDAQKPTEDAGLPTEEITPPTENLAEDFSHLWVEYWNPKYNYGLTLPAHWVVENDSAGGGFMSTRSYDQDYFLANSIKGNWIGGEPPEGAIKLDFVGFEGIVPEQSLDVAISDILGQDPEMTVVLSVEEKKIGEQEAVLITTARPENLNEPFTSAAFRLSPETILLVAPYPTDALNSSNVQAILNSLVLSKSTPILKPRTAPQPPLTVNSEASGLPTQSEVIAWYGHIASLPQGENYDDKVVLLPLGTGEFGIKGSSPDMESLIQSLRDATGTNEYVHLWGALFCNVDDYNTCQINVERLEFGDQYTGGYGEVEGWVGTIKTRTFNDETSYAFELAEDVPVLYGIAAGNDEVIQDQIEALSDSGTIVSVTGELLVGVQDVNGTRIEVHTLNPPGPGALPASSACEPGYPGTVDEMLEILRYNLEIGNHYPFSYMIGNPFVIGYWRSEGISLPRQEAFNQLEANYFPSPDEVINISDPALFPDLEGIPLSTIWGPDVDVAANLYSKGWGVDGNGEAILVIASCSNSDAEGYYWYGMLYAMDGFK